MLPYTRALFPLVRNSNKNRRIGGLFYMLVTWGLMRPLARVSPRLIFAGSHRIGGTFLHAGDLGANAPIGARSPRVSFLPKVAELGGFSTCW